MLPILFNGSFRQLFSEGKNASHNGAIEIQLSADLKGLLHVIAIESLYCRNNHQLSKLKDLFFQEHRGLCGQKQPEFQSELYSIFRKLEDLCEGIFLASVYSAKSSERLEQLMKELAAHALVQHLTVDANNY